MYTFDRKILISWNLVIFTWSWCMLCESHKLLDTCNLVPPPPALLLLDGFSLIFVVGLCNWPNDELLLLALPLLVPLLLLLLELLTLFPCNFAADGKSQSFWFPEMPLNRKSTKSYVVDASWKEQKNIQLIFRVFFSCPEGISDLNQWHQKITSSESESTWRWRKFGMERKRREEKKN